MYLFCSDGCYHRWHQGEAKQEGRDSKTRGANNP